MWTLAELGTGVLKIQLLASYVSLSTDSFMPLVYPGVPLLEEGSLILGIIDGIIGS